MKSKSKAPVDKADKTCEGVDLKLKDLESKMQTSIESMTKDIRRLRDEMAMTRGVAVWPGRIAKTAGPEFPHQLPNDARFANRQNMNLLFAIFTLERFGFRPGIWKVRLNW